MSPPIIMPGLPTIWVSLSTYLMFLMQLGFGFLEAGTIRYKNIHSILLKNILDASIAGITYWMFGYNFAYGESQGGFIGWSEELICYQDISLQAQYKNYYTHILMQWAFVSTSTTILSGSIAERLPAKTYAVICLIISIFVYPIQTHWVWAEGGFLREMGFHDLAGDAAVHTLGGIWGLVGSYMAGPRKNYFQQNLIRDDQDKFKPGNVPFIVLGTLILWFGWFGFNCGSVILDLSSEEIQFEIGLIASNTTLSCVAGGIGSYLYFAIKTRQNTRIIVNQYNIKLAQGLVAGLVSITGSADVVTLQISLIIGLVGGFIYSFLSELLIRFKIDDPLECSSLHGGCGIWGLLAVGLFDKDNGLFINGGDQIVTQLKGIGIIMLFNLVISLIVFKICKRMNSLLVSHQQQTKGIDDPQQNLIHRPGLVNELQQYKRSIQESEKILNC